MIHLINTTPERDCWKVIGYTVKAKLIKGKLTATEMKGEFINKKKTEVEIDIDVLTLQNCLTLLNDKKDINDKYPLRLGTIKDNADI